MRACVCVTHLALIDARVGDCIQRDVEVVCMMSMTNWRLHYIEYDHHP